jgi:endogenous inhibitor of DNA gyrase (YacG/DUF329 family)
VPTYNDNVARCPTCRGDVKPRGENPSFPFCSPRCRAVDLGRWFTGEYRVPGETASPEPKGRREDEDREKN